MAIDKKIRFGVEGGEEITTYMQRFHQFAEKQAKDIADYARVSGKSNADSLKSIEDQIAAIEKRNKLEEQYRKSQIKVGATSGEVSDPAKALSEAAKTTEEDKLSVQILKDILEVDKQTLREKIKEDRESSAEIQQKEKELDAENKRKQKADQEASSSSRGAVQAGAGIGLSKNEFYAAAGLLAFIPLFGQALSAGAQKALGAANDYQTGLGANVGIGGGKQGDLYGFGQGQTKYGFSMADALQERVAVSRARGSVAGAGQGALDSQLLQRGAGLDQATVLGLERLQRGGGNGTTKESVQSLVSGLKSSGAMKGNDLTLLPEYLQMLTAIGQEQINTLGKIDMGVNEKLVLGIQTLDTSFKNPDTLKAVVESIRGTLSSSKTPQMEALQYSVLAKLNPNASFVELQEKKDMPSLEYYKAFTGTLKERSANDDQYIQNIKAAFGVKTSIARKMAEGDFGEVDFSDHLRRNINCIHQRNLSGNLQRYQARAGGHLQHNMIRLDLSTNFFNKHLIAFGKSIKKPVIAGSGSAPESLLLINTTFFRDHMILTYAFLERRVCRSPGLRCEKRLHESDDPTSPDYRPRDYGFHRSDGIQVGRLSLSMSRRKSSIHPESST